MSEADEDVASYTPASLAVDTPDELLGTARARGLALQQAERTLVWIQSDRYTTQELIRGFEKALRARKAKGWKYDPPEISGAAFHLNDMAGCRRYRSGEIDRYSICRLRYNCHVSQFLC